MFNFNKEEKSNQQVERELEKMLAKMLSQALLDSETTPESTKLVVRIVDQSGNIVDAMQKKILEKYCRPENRANLETLKKILEYLELVEIGIKQFSESTPFVKGAEEE